MACGGDSRDDSGYFSDFVINNESNHTLLLSYSLFGAESLMFESEEIEVGQVLRFHQEFSMANSINSAPSPESTFAEVSVSIVGSDDSVELEDMKDNSHWAHSLSDSLTIYTLTVSNDDFD